MPASICAWTIGKRYNLYNFFIQNRGAAKHSNPFEKLTVGYGKGREKRTVLKIYFSQGLLTVIAIRTTHALFTKKRKEKSNETSFTPAL